jgi:serine/threonine-protein kinase
MFRHEPVDDRSDLYACGVVLFRMLAGRLPYNETQPQALWGERYAEREKPVERPRVRSFEPFVSEALDACVAKALRLDPAARYQSAEEMQRALLQIEADEFGGRTAGADTPAEIPVVAPTTDRRPSAASGAAVSPGPPRRRRIWLTAAIGAAAVLAGATLYWLGTLAGTARTAAPSGPPPDAALAAAGDTTSPPEAAAAVERVAAATDPANGADAGAPAAPTAAGEDVAPPVAAADAPPAGAPVAVATAEEDAADAGPAPPAGDTVHFSFEGVPAGSRGMIAGREFDPAVGVDVRRSGRRVMLFITPGDDGLQPWRSGVVPSQDRVLRPHFPRR